MPQSGMAGHSWRRNKLLPCCNPQLQRLRQLLQPLRLLLCRVHVKRPETSKPSQDLAGNGGWSPRARDLCVKPRDSNRGNSQQFDIPPREVALCFAVCNPARKQMSCFLHHSILLDAQYLFVTFGSSGPQLHLIRH